MSGPAAGALPLLEASKHFHRSGGLPWSCSSFSMSPFDRGGSLSVYVARSIDIIDESGLPYRLTPMGTIVEGEWDEVMAVVSACFKG